MPFWRFGIEVRAVTTTEEIIVSGQDFIERRIFVCPEQEDLANMRERAYGGGYKRGWLRGFLVGALGVAVAAFCLWLATR